MVRLSVVIIPAYRCPAAVEKAAARGAAAADDDGKIANFGGRNGVSGGFSAGRRGEGQPNIAQEESDAPAPRFGDRDPGAAANRGAELRGGMGQEGGGRGGGVRRALAICQGELEVEGAGARAPC
jgi:hypothetical protein